MIQAVLSNCFEHCLLNIIQIISNFLVDFMMWSEFRPEFCVHCTSKNRWPPSTYFNNVIRILFKQILPGYDYAINSSNNLTTKMAVHSTLTSKRTLCRHLLWGETQESSPQSREGKGYLREQVYFKRPSIHTAWIWICMTKRPAATSDNGFVSKKRNGIKI